MGREGEGDLSQQCDPHPRRARFGRWSVNGVLQLDDFRGITQAYRDDIKPHVTLPVGRINKILRSTKHSFRFPPVDKILGLPVFDRRARLYLHEDEPVVALSNNVDLRLAEPVVAEEDRIPFPYQVVGSQLLAFGSGLHFIGHDIVIPLNREISDYVSDTETH